MGTKKDFTQSAAAQFFSGAEPTAKDNVKEGAQMTAPALQDGFPNPALRDGFFDDAEKADRAAQNMAYVTRRRNTPRQKPEYGEARSRRLNLLLKPSVYERAAALADAKGISFNYLTELAITEFVNNHSADDDISGSQN